MIWLFGIASTRSRDIDDWKITREEAENAIRLIVSDDPLLADVVFAVGVPFWFSTN